MNALLIVDLQKDFLPGGALATPEGDKVVAPINEMQDEFDLVVASKDWHPPDKVQHFQKWPPHCIQNTEGAEFPDNLNRGNIAFVFKKGTGKDDDGYSSFEAVNRDLEAYLKEKGVTKVFIAGLTTEYCVRFTTLDALRRNFDTYVIEDAIEGVRQEEGDEEKAKKEMAEAGAQLIRAEEIPNILGH